MFQEQLAEQLADHFRSHIKAYLEEANDAWPAGERETVRTGATVETASLAGGVMGIEIEKLPAFAVDVNNKVVAQVSEDLFLYEYNGQIAGLVIAGSQRSVNRLAKRYERATEKFIKEHEMVHSLETADYTVVRLVFQATDFSGAEEVTIEQKAVWIDGFRVDFSLVVSENGPRQH